MTKQEAIDLLAWANSASPLGDLAYMLDISSSALSQWPKELEKKHIRRLHSAAVEYGYSEKVINKLEKLLKTMRG